MSYSRWYNSTWYTFWTASSPTTTCKLPTKKLKRGQTFEICDFPSYHLTYGELEDKGINGTMIDIRRFYKSSHDGKIFNGWNELEDGRKIPIYKATTYGPKNPTEDEMLELMGYIREWQEDVDRHFKFWTFIRYEWYYPIRNKIKRLWKKILKHS